MVYINAEHLQKEETVLAERGQSFTINEIKKPLRWAARFFLSMFPLLNSCFTYAKNGSKHGLANMVSCPNAPDVFRLKWPLRR